MNRSPDQRKIGNKEAQLAKIIAVLKKENKALKAARDTKTKALIEAQTMSHAYKAELEKVSEEKKKITNEKYKFQLALQEANGKLMRYKRRKQEVLRLLDEFTAEDNNT